MTQASSYTNPGLLVEDKTVGRKEGQQGSGKPTTTQAGRCGWAVGCAAWLRNGEFGIYGKGGAIRKSRTEVALVRNSPAEHDTADPGRPGFRVHKAVLWTENRGGVPQRSR